MGPLSLVWSHFHSLLLPCHHLVLVSLFGGKWGYTEGRAEGSESCPEGRPLLLLTGHGRPPALHAGEDTQPHSHGVGGSGVTGGTEAPTLTKALTLVMSPNADLFLGPPWGEDGDLLA